MKKTWVGILTAAIVLSAGAAGVVTAAPGYGANFVDIDGDGICDYAGNACRNIRANGQGGYGCRGAGQNRGGNESKYGANFVDTNGNGICDHFEERQENGQGNGFHGGRNR